ncbi:uncharacterized protein ACNS7B_012358 [Menidia menidia]
MLISNFFLNKCTTIFQLKRNSCIFIMETMEIDDRDADSMNKTLMTEGIAQRKKLNRAVIVFLGLLCGVLLAANVAQALFYEFIQRPPTQANSSVLTQSNNNLTSTKRDSIKGNQQLLDSFRALKTEMDELEDSYRSVTQDRDLFRANYSSLKQDRDLFQANYSSLKQERDLFRANYSSLKQDRDLFRANYSSLKQDRDLLRANYSSLKQDWDLFRANYSSLKQDRDQLKENYEEAQRSLEALWTNHSLLMSSFNQIQTNHSSLETEKHQLQTLFSELKKNLDQLESKYSSLIRDRDQLEMSLNRLNMSKSHTEISYDSLWKDKNQLEKMYDTIWKENGQLKSNYSTMESDRDRIQATVNKLTAKVRAGMSCPTHWRKFETSCYFISTGKKNWTQSRESCISAGADLLVIENHREQEFVNKQLELKQNIWIGLSDSLEEGVWTWVDGSPVTTEFWEPGQPNSFSGDQDCVEFLQNPQEGAWNDDGCFVKQAWICEI